MFLNTVFKYRWLISGICLLLPLCGCDDNEATSEDPCSLEATKDILANYDLCKDITYEADIAWIKDGEISKPNTKLGGTTIKQKCVVVCGSNSLPEDFESIKISQDTMVIGIERNGEQPGIKFTNLTQPLFDVKNGVKFTLSNLDLSGDAVLGNLHGIIANDLSDATIEHIRYEGTIKSNLPASSVSNLGGILVGTIGSGTISHCSIHGNTSIEINAKDAVAEFGGLTGYAIETSIHDNTIDVSSELLMKLTAPRNISSIGGFVGRMVDGELSNNIFKNGKIEVKLSSESENLNGSDHSIDMIGGWIGNAEKTFIHDNRIEQFSLRVSGGADTMSVGGAIGQIKAGRVEHNSIHGEMDVSGEQRTMYVGGLIGYGGDPSFQGDNGSGYNAINDTKLLKNPVGNHVSLTHLYVDTPKGNHHSIGGFMGKLAHLYFSITNSSVNISDLRIQSLNDKNKSLMSDGVGAIIGNGTFNPTVNSGRSIVALENVQTVISKVSLTIGGENKNALFGSMFGMGRIKDTSNHIFSYINNPEIDYSCEKPTADNVFRYMPDSTDSEKYYTDLCGEGTSESSGSSAKLYSSDEVFCRLSQNNDNLISWQSYDLSGKHLTLFNPAKALSLAEHTAPACSN